MDQGFQTSFIPKTPIVEERVFTPRPVGIFTLVSIFIFLSVLLSSGGLYVYKRYLISQIIKFGNELEETKKKFEEDIIGKIKTLDNRINSVNEILENHVSVSPIFEVLQAVTVKTIRYTQFNYNMNPTGKNEEKAKISLKGQSSGYEAIAIQSDVFSRRGKNDLGYNLIDPVFSNLSLDKNNNVLFDLEFFVEKNLINYAESLKTKKEKQKAKTLEEAKEAQANEETETNEETEDNEETEKATEKEAKTEAKTEIDSKDSATSVFNLKDEKENINDNKKSIKEDKERR